MRRLLHVSQKLNSSIAGFAFYLDLQGEPISLVHHGSNGGHAQTGGHNLFHVLHQLRPGKRFSQNGVVQELRFIARAPVLRTCKHLLRQRRFFLELCQFCLRLTRALPFALRILIVTDGDKHHESGEQRGKCECRSPVAIELSLILVRTGSQINGDLHERVSTPAIPASADLGIPSPERLSPTSIPESRPSGRIPVCSCNAWARSSLGKDEIRNICSILAE